MIEGINVGLRRGLSPIREDKDKQDKGSNLVREDKDKQDKGSNLVKNKGSNLDLTYKAFYASSHGKASADRIRRRVLPRNESW